MKKEYMKPSVIITAFAEEDIIITSGVVQTKSNGKEALVYNVFTGNWDLNGGE
ncbi:MAG: hypothetical protein PUB07_06195 [Clostridia bacterium]|nr:hypothetical protein [Clostridia bacterium]